MDTKPEKDPATESESESESDDKSSDTSFMDQVDKIIDAQVDENVTESEESGEEKKPADKADKKDAAQDDDLDSKGDEDGDDEGEDKDLVADESLIERAVRSGMSLGDAQAIGKTGRLEGVVERQEAANKRAESSGKESEDEDGEEEDDLLKDIPDLDPEEHPEEVVDGFKAMKQIIAQQQDSIKNLKQSIDSQDTWVDGRIVELGKEYVDVFGSGTYADLQEGKQKTMRDKLQRHIELVEQDAKDEGENITRAETFKRALDSGFSKIADKAKGQVQKKAAETRSKKAIAQPRTSTGQFDVANDSNTEEDLEAEAVRYLNAEYYEK